MSGVEKTITEHFTRQRRNLILISLFIIFYKIADLKVQEINFFGNNVTVENSEAVLSSMIVFFMYFLWRYYTVCREVNGIYHFREACYSWAKKKCREYVRKRYINGPNSKGEYINIDDSNQKKHGIFYTIHKYGNLADSPCDEVYITWRLWCNCFLAFFSVTFKTSHFSEYIFPYIIAGLAITEYFGLGCVGGTFDSFQGEFVVAGERADSFSYCTQAVDITEF